jgi:PD-(D/E)XK endonuclease
MLALQDAGNRVLVPFGENTRYDLVIERAGKFSRVQCKTGRLLKGAVCFRTSSSYFHHPNPKIYVRDYKGQVDLFAVFCPETGAVYLVPIEDVPPMNQASLRVEPARNNQRSGVRLGTDYQIARVAIEGLRGSSGA